MQDSINAGYGTGRVRRFGAPRIVEHWILIITFFTLVATGLSQKFYYLGLSQWVIMQLGGIDSARLIHRIAGMSFAALVTLHVGMAALGVALKKWQPSMIINKSDYENAVQNIKYYVGMVNEPARCDRYDYKEKFGYWCVLCGGIMMVFTGLVLWFPAAVARYLPGELIPTAKALHTNEALLILLLVAVWHVYDAIFSPNVFPLDTSIFTGYISRERMLREHPLELARIEAQRVGEGQDDKPVPDG